MKITATPLSCLLAVLASAALAQAPAAEPAPAAAQRRIVLLVDEIKAIRNFPVVLAERLGYLGDAGTLVTVMNIRDDAPTAQMLMDGRVDAEKRIAQLLNNEPLLGKIASQALTDADKAGE